MSWTPSPTPQNQQSRGLDSFEVVCGDQRFEATDPKGLELVTIEDDLDLIGVCEVSFAVGHPGVRWEELSIGAKIEVSVGPEPGPLFEGWISGLRHRYQSGRNTLTVTAMDPLMKLASSRRTQVYEKRSHSQVVQDVLDRVRIPGGTIDPTRKVHPYTIQRSESDLGFLRRLAAENDRLLVAYEGRVDFRKPQSSADPREIPKDRVISLDTRLSPREIPGRVTVMGWDYRSKKGVIGSASEADVVAIGDGATAADGRLFEEATISDLWVDCQDHAKKLAQAQLNQDAQRLVKGTARVEGDRTLRAGSMVRFSGHPKGFNATALAVSTRHRVSSHGGYTTELVLCSNTYPT